MDIVKEAGSKPPSTLAVYESSDEKGSAGDDEGTAVSFAAPSDSAAELEKELILSSKAELKKDSKDNLTSDIPDSGSVNEVVDPSVVKDLDDEVLASPQTSARRAQKDHGFSSPGPIRKPASPGRIPGASGYRLSSGTMESPYPGHRVPPKMPVLAMPPRKPNRCKRYWLPLSVVCIALIITIAVIVGVQYTGAFHCKTFEDKRCQLFGADNCVRGDAGPECRCKNGSDIVACMRPTCRDVARVKCFNRVCIEPTRCVLAREYIKTLSREDRGSDVSCAEVLSEICASGGLIPFCAKSGSYALGHYCNPDPLRPVYCDPRPLGFHPGEHDQSPDEVNSTDFCHRERFIYACIVGLLDRNAASNATVINCYKLCPRWEGDGCRCTRSTGLKSEAGKSTDGFTLSQRCVPKSLPERCAKPPKFIDQLKTAWFTIENDIAAANFHSNIEDFELFLERVRVVEPNYVDDYVRLYMKAREDLVFNNSTCLPLILTLGGLYLTSAEAGQEFLKEIHRMTLWNKPRLSTRLPPTSQIEYFFFTDPIAVFTIDDPCDWDSRAHRRVGPRIDTNYYASAQLVHFLGGNVSNDSIADGPSWGALKLAEDTWYRYMMCLEPGPYTMECERILFWRFRTTWALNAKERQFLEDIYNGSLEDLSDGLVSVEDELYWAVRLLRIFTNNISSVKLRPGDYPTLPTTPAPTTSSWSENSRTTAAINSNNMTEMTIEPSLYDVKTDSMKTFERMAVLMKGDTVNPPEDNSGWLELAKEDSARKMTLETERQRHSEAMFVYTSENRVSLKKKDIMPKDTAADVVDTKKSFAESDFMRVRPGYESIKQESNNPRDGYKSKGNSIRHELRRYICDCVLGVRC